MQINNMKNSRRANPINQDKGNIKIMAETYEIVSNRNSSKWQSFIRKIDFR